MLKKLSDKFILVAALLGVVLVPVLGAGSAVAAAPCNSIGGGKYNCTFWTNTYLEGPSNGYIHAGTNWVTCQQRGKAVTATGASGKQWTNDWWAWTLRDKGTGTYGDGWGWVNAVYVKGGTDFSGAPNCNGAHGAAPQAAAPTQSTQPGQPSTPQTPASDPSHGASTPTTVTQTTNPAVNDHPTPQGSVAPYVSNDQTNYDGGSSDPSKTDPYQTSTPEETARYTCAADLNNKSYRSQTTCMMNHTDKHAARWLIANDL